MLTRGREFSLRYRYQITCTTRYDVYAEEFLINRPLPYNTTHGIFIGSPVHTPLSGGTPLEEPINRCRPACTTIAYAPTRFTIAAIGTERKRRVRSVTEIIHFQRVRDIFAVGRRVRYARRDSFEIFRFREQFSRSKQT